MAEIVACEAWPALAIRAPHPPAGQAAWTLSAFGIAHAWDYDLRVCAMPVSAAVRDQLVLSLRRAAFAIINIPDKDQTWERVCLPGPLGGLSLRSPLEEVHAAAYWATWTTHYAHVASVTSRLGRPAAPVGGADAAEAAQYMHRKGSPFYTTDPAYHPPRPLRYDAA